MLLTLSVPTAHISSKHQGQKRGEEYKFGPNSPLGTCTGSHVCSHIFLAAGSWWHVPWVAFTSLSCLYLSCEGPGSLSTLIDCLSSYDDDYMSCLMEGSWTFLFSLLCYFCIIIKTVKSDVPLLSDVGRLLSVSSLLDSVWTIVLRLHPTFTHVVGRSGQSVISVLTCVVWKDF